MSFRSLKSLYALGLGLAVPIFSMSSAWSQSAALVEQVAQAQGDWRSAVRDYLIQGVNPGDRSAVTDRSTALVRAVHDRCRSGGCAATPSGVYTPVLDLGNLAKSSVCAAYPIDMVCVRRFRVPPTTQAFDFKPPRHGAVYPGMTPVVPGDARLSGGATGARYNDAYPASGDSLIDVRGFSTPAAPGLYRVILVSGKRPLAQALSSPFGRQILINDQPYDVVAAGPDRWLPRAAMGNGTPQSVFQPGNVLPGSAPSVILEVQNNGSAINIVLPQGGEVAALLIEPVGGEQSIILDAGNASDGIVTNPVCLREQSRIDEVISRLPPPAPVAGRGAPPPPPPPPPPAPPVCGTSTPGGQPGSGNPLSCS